MKTENCFGNVKLDEVYFNRIGENKRGKRLHFLQMHHRYELVYRLSGHVVGKFDETHFDGKPDVIEIMPRRRVSEYYVDIKEPGESVIIYFFTDNDFTDTIMTFDASDKPRLRELFLKINTLWKKHNDGYYYKCMVVFYEILNEIRRFQPDYAPKSMQERISPGVSYLHERCYDPYFSYARLSDICGMSYTYFKKIFISQYKMSPIKYITMLRMNRAAELLMQGKLKIGEISEMVGYQNSYYFGRVFKNYFGCPPSEYKK